MIPESVQAVLSAISQVGSFDEFGRVIVEACAKQFDAEVCTVWRRYKDDKGADRLRLMAASAKAPQTIAQEITYALNEEDREGKHADGVTGYIAQTRQEVHVTAFEQFQSQFSHCWKGRMDKIQWSGQPEKLLRSLFGIPLVLGDRLVGVMKLENKRNSQDGFSEPDRAAIRTLAPYLALAVHAFAMLEPHEERLIQVPANMVARLLHPFDPKQLVSEIVKTVAENLHAEFCSLWLVDSGGSILRLADGYGFNAAGRVELTYRLCDPNEDDSKIEGITAWVAVRRRSFWANSWEELRQHPSWKGKWDSVQWPDLSRAFRCLYAIPLLREDRVVGVLKVENSRDAAFFTDSDRALCGIMASLIVLVLDMSQQVRTSLISDLAHLMRSPIGQVSMNLNGLEREIGLLRECGKFDHDRVGKYIDFIKRSLLHVIVASRTMSAFAQKSSLSLETAERETVHLADLIKQRVGELQSLLYSGIQIEVDLAGAEQVCLKLDVTERTRVSIVIDNLVHNAIKYCKPLGKVFVRLTHQDGQTAQLEIEDQGQGIRREDLSRVFESGFTRRAPEHPEGTGMGLTTVKQILDGFGWKFALTSDLGVGTKFTIFVPLE